ncbi:uncharacterized protein LOC101456448 [Ceratitis capitata]|uniref:uncharacterized protein LOC101456448 n=1 Tax=Ceratitis capitata TaxID=7213 RepID=UPI00032A314D|nr:uncharacterized protein LOC101456448 [Ceratitis capitata]XP_020714486.1 uncharacterized protein LOC101456448 [Ceratitis capitata]XP_020714487.1 uncharacterized protein LOC101456448 [Ceratitis capitata]
MSSRRAQSLPPHMLDEKPTRGKCVTAICFSWKVISCVVSHVILVLMVVSYCVGGAYLFQHLEKPHEIEVKRDILNLRLNLTDKIWRFSDNASVLSQIDWIANVKKDLAGFETQIVTAIKTNGWDGDEDVTKSQWTFAGSLFYSIIVITTIGYGHISPRTDWGKVTTIFYAIVGIPLMLLCLSNIGDVMATSFRFIYWRVCCYVCTRAARRPRRPRQRGRSQRYTSRSQPPPIRRSMRLTQRSMADSGFGNSVGLPHAYSDPELRGGRYDYEGGRNSGRRHQHNSSSQRRGQIPPYQYEQQQYYDEGPRYTQTLNRGSKFGRSIRNRESIRGRHTVERERYLGHSSRLGSFEDLHNLPPPSHSKRTYSMRSVRASSARRDVAPPPQVQAREMRDMREPPRESREMREFNRMNPRTMQRGRSVPQAPPTTRAKSVDPRLHYEDAVDEEVVRKTPIIPNRYAIDELDHNRIESRDYRGKHMPRSQSMPRSALLKSSGYNAQHSNGVSSYHSHHNQPRLASPQPATPPPHRHHSGGHHSHYGDRLELPDFGSPRMNHPKRGRSPAPIDDYDEDFDDYYLDDVFDEYDNREQAYQPRHRDRRYRRERAERLPPSPRIMSPMGFPVKRQVRRRPSYDYDDDSCYGDDWSDYYGDISPKDRPVPIWLCVFLVISYILGGAALFAYWEKWSFLDSAYFCFITLTTIGFGDFVPAKGVKDESEQSIAYCSLYLLFGIALLAMSFNLVQEEFISNVKEVARRLGILKDEEDDD